jgi:hypothetical protein
MTPDRISDPTHHCHKHNQSFYFHCVRCFNSNHAQPVASEGQAVPERDWGANWEAAAQA